MKLNLPPVEVKVKQLETIADELDSKRKMKLKEMENLENEIKSVKDKYIQLKARPNLIEDKPISQSSEIKVHILCIHIVKY